LGGSGHEKANKLKMPIARRNRGEKEVITEGSAKKKLRVRRFDESSNKVPKRNGRVTAVELWIWQGGRNLARDIKNAYISTGVFNSHLKRGGSGGRQFRLNVL